MYQIIQKRKIWLTISTILVVLSIIALAVWQLNFGIDFTGGSLLEVKFLEERPEISKVHDALDGLNLESLTAQPVSSDGLILRFQDISEAKHQEILKRLGNINYKNKASSEISSTSSPAKEVGSEQVAGEINTKNYSMLPKENNKIEELRFDSVGPSIGRELKHKSIYAIIAVLIAIILYVAWAFRKVSKPIASWKYGVTAVIALFHDVLITMGVFAVLGRYLGVEVNTPFVAAILTVLGYSVNDTIVVFDRIRENLPRSDEDFEGTVNISVNQTISRSINTSLTTLLVLLSIFFFGGSTIRNFVLALSIGVFIGTYSSIFLASPVLVVWEKLQSRNL